MTHQPGRFGGRYTSYTVSILSIQLLLSGSYSEVFATGVVAMVWGWVLVVVGNVVADFVLIVDVDGMKSFVLRCCLTLFDGH
jgi:hypothetical protein